LLDDALKQRIDNSALRVTEMGVESGGVGRPLGLRPREAKNVGELMFQIQRRDGHFMSTDLLSMMVDLEVVLHHKTDSAVLVSLDGDRAKAKWLPKSPIELEPIPRSKFHTLTLPE
jgi:hypothetical protein